MSNVASTIIANATSAPTAAPVEGKVEGQSAPAAPKEEDAISPKLGLIARKERALVQKQQEFQRQQQEWQKQKDELTARIQTMQEKETMWKSSPEKALEEYGHNYQSLTERMLAGGELSPAALEKKLNERLQTFEEKMAAEKKALQEAQEKQRKQEADAAVESFKDDLRSFISGNASEYKLTALLDKEGQTTFETIDAYYQLHGKILSNNEAAALVEKYYKKLLDEANNALTPPKKEEGAPEDGFSLPGVSKTLSNTMQSTAPSMLPAKNEQDRINRALAALGN